MKYEEVPFYWRDTWLFKDLNNIDNSIALKQFIIKYHKNEKYHPKWIKECITECFPQHIDTLNKILILL
jgi:hypothetical protein